MSCIKCYFSSFYHVRLWNKKILLIDTVIMVQKSNASNSSLHTANFSRYHESWSKRYEDYHLFGDMTKTSMCAWSTDIYIHFARFNI